ncbi:MAG: repressor LexA [Candidatus Kerfeldbacteria bacterium CG15_BIG_FIL_POST_REV_8_21_14_020_45_12]|uniref:LexA repressor n=1 Tax=Candidatus Kerfeldbacteria bacterium CG15_BIG_FIL_POST_REV_8_21_14_020_45_12 TaxID=2014247 RepID=A0A2M7H386_9BACT|nr:MAG: repressor LexA [Candidatus Kerfeldbacteria bacterium CG15_BIG_FIL_POST_REV_8_21_14_020_45_12]PJA93842.1 MAG: repressor LexA [Candidatus Kerfeldbacteria bacterium CG_4_9_14_3_um_filter_45_8]
MTKVLPKKKREILSFLEDFISDRGYAPTLKDIADHFGLSSTATVHEHIAYLEEHGFITRDDGEIGLALQRQAQDDSDNYLAGSAFQLPIVGLITAGAPIEAIEDRTAMLTVPRELASRPDCYILKVKGDSMVESLIDDGDFVVIQKQDFARDGDIVVALLEDGGATLKEYHKERNYVRLQPKNKKYDPIKVKNVIIQGKVVGIIRQF